MPRHSRRWRHELVEGPLNCYSFGRKMTEFGIALLQRKAACQGEAVRRRLNPQLRNHVEVPSHSSSACMGSFVSESIELQQANGTLGTTIGSGVFRWLSKDPIGISGGLNQYVFCGNNPVNFRDPFGLCEEGRNFWGRYQDYMTSTAALQGIGGYTVGAIEAVAGLPEGLWTFITHPIATVAAIPAGVMATVDQMFGPDPYQSGRAIGGVVGNIELAIAAGGIARAYRIPDNVYHFTTAEGGAGINGLGAIRASGGGIRGPGTYFTSSTSPGVAIVQGAQGAAAVTRVSTAGLPLSRTLVPGTFVVRNASVLLR